MEAIRAALDAGAKLEEGTVRMNRMLRTVRREAAGDPRLETRVERASGRTFPCDYSYLFGTTQKQLGTQSCAALAYDPKLRSEQCLFDANVASAVWLTSVWDCLAFTETVGEGGSCHRMCDYDDYCAAQVSCAAPDFDLVLCSLGVCLPEKVRGIY